MTAHSLKASALILPLRADRQKAVAFLSAANALIHTTVDDKRADAAEGRTPSPCGFGLQSRPKQGEGAAQGRSLCLKRQQARSPATTDAILDVAAHILGECGWAGLTTNTVAEVAGISIGSLYQYSPNKLAMIGTVHRRHFDQVLAVLRAAADEKATRRTFHFTPTSMPWLNAVEAFFAKLTNRRPR